MIELQDFRDKGVCGPYYAETGKDHWFGPADDDPEYHVRTREAARKRKRERERARALCAICPVQAMCLQWAMENNVSDGIWGGLTPAERTSLRNREEAIAS